ncbi:MAG: TIR domain-containing protein [Leptolyngbya sp. SIO1D8]|nr:TIR domain-containing protein [Leptolyngbya sp. SIO1D8]
MNVNEALAFVDQHLCAKTGRHLTDLEKAVFEGSWQGKTYEEIHPQNPAYVEKTLAYRLWRKLSVALDEKVSKKQIKGAIERAWLKQRHVFISYRGQGAASAIAKKLDISLKSWGYPTFVSDLDAISVVPAAEDTQTQESIVQALQRCSCFVLLLSPQTAVSEMAIEQLRQLQQETGRQGTPPPQLVVIWVDNAHLSLLNYDLCTYLAGAYHWSWEVEVSPLETLERLKAILEQDTDAIAQFAFETLTSESLAWEVLENSKNGFNNRNTADTAETAPLSTVIHPSPVAAPEIPRFQVRPDSKFYIERIPYEMQCYEEIERAGALIRIKAPRQMGKTSLMARILNQAREKRYRAIPISFQHADRHIFEDLGSLLRWFCAIVAHKLQLPHRLEDYWDDIFGSKSNCTTYFKEYLLPAIEGPLVLGLDEVDKVFQCPVVADDFFGLLRAWYEEGSYGSDDSQLWERLRLIIVHSTEVYLPLDVNQSPFNVGLPIELPEFTLEQVAMLIQRHGLTMSTEDVETLMALIGGHPYLVRLALYHLVHNQLTLAELYDTGPTEAGIYGDHLRRHLANLKQNPELAEAYQAILDASTPIQLDSEPMFKLHSLGLVHLKGNGAVPSFELYRRYFSDRLKKPSS